MSMTRPPSPVVSKQRAHCINIGAAYKIVCNLRYAERFKGEAPSTDWLDYLEKLLKQYNPPIEAMAAKHAIASCQVARWHQILKTSQ